MLQRELLLSPPALTDRPVALKTYDFHVITPMFGGGSIVRACDPDYLIRGSAIRGHLRFWWRATRGARYSGVKELFEAEARVWGSSDAASPVRVLPRVDDPGSDVLPTRSTDDNKANPYFPSYALFPFMPDRKNGKSGRPGTSAASGRKGIRFTLLVSCPAELQAEVTAALWAWANFGGIGARTRRGCGALYCPDFAPQDISSVAALITWFANSLREHDAFFTSVDRLWPVLSPDFLLAKRQPSNRRGTQRVVDPELEDAEYAWKAAIEVMQRFRQGAGIGRRNRDTSNTGTNGERPTPGRSFWPEADSLRRIAAISTGRHAEKITTDYNVFPRAEFGLPIVFHFKGGPKDGDPEHDAIAYPARGTGQRMASPIILRPLQCKTGSSGDSSAAFYSIILRLKAPTIDEVRLDFDSAKTQAKQFPVQDARNDAYARSPMAERTACGSAVEAFLQFARAREGFA